MLSGLSCKCGKRLKVPESRLGKTGTCPYCRSPLRLVAPGYDRQPAPFSGLLEIVSGPDRVGEVILLGGPGPIEIGRSPQENLILASSRVSRAHCRLLRQPRGWRIEDNKSTSGLYLNGRRIDQANLESNDKLRIGDYELRYVLPHGKTRDSAAQSAPPRNAEEPVTAAGSYSAEAARSGSEDESFSPSMLNDGLDDDSLYHLSDGDVLEEVRQESPVASVSAPAHSGGPVCPSCQRSLAPNAKICIACGIDVKTGRAILTSHDADLDTVYERAESAVRWLSWLVWMGIYPVASEAFGVRKPYFIRTIAIITVLTSIWFWRYEWTDSPSMVTAKNYMLWVGQGRPDPTLTLLRYNLTTYGDGEAFNEEFERIGEERQRARGQSGVRPRAAADQKDESWFEESSDQEIEEIILAAHDALPPAKQCYGRYSPGQLITYAFLHADILHLAGNMLFLLVIGSRVNALVGNLPMLVIYPALSAAAAVIFMASEQSSPPTPMLGASGAVMGLAGMYLVLMPVYTVHMAAWMRLGIITGFRLYFKLFAIRGFWVVLFYIGFDVFYTALGWEDGVAHWAHLGGFLFGVGIGLVLLFTRLVNCRGGDMASALLGRHAWALVGKPDPNRKAPLEYGW